MRQLFCCKYMQAQRRKFSSCLYGFISTKEWTDSVKNGTIEPEAALCWLLGGICPDIWWHDERINFVRLTGKVLLCGMKIRLNVPGGHENTDC